MKKLPLLLLLQALAGAAFAQLIPLGAVFTDTTKYRKPLAADTMHYTPLSHSNDSVFVFYERLATLKATQPNGRAARFVWQRLDTATLSFTTIWVDTVELRCDTSRYAPITIDSSDCGHLLPAMLSYTSLRNTSELPDSLPTGYYRVIADTLQTLDSTVLCNRYISSDTINEGSRALITSVGITFAPADTVGAWVFIDTFRIDTIWLVSQDCEFLNLQARFFPLGVNEGYYRYTYIDLWRTPKKEIRDFPDCLDCYIRKVSWEPSVDIYEGTELDVSEDWKTSYNAYIPTPFYDASYKVVVENYFGAADTFATDTIEAFSTYAKMKMFVEKTNDGGAKNWEEKTNEEEKEMALATIYLANATINAKAGSTFTWRFYSNTYELPENAKISDWLTLLPQAVTTDTSEEVYLPQPYKPGLYPFTLHVLNQRGCISTDTFKLEVEEYLIDPKAIPSVFTPNNDGVNDLYQLSNPNENVHSVDAIEVSILNRYGQLVFHSRDIRFAWNGKLRGTNSAAADGVYYYIIKAQGFNKTRKQVKQTFKGYLHLFNGQ
ncbi:MAG: gliding motility-associated C-terminal domain-containing protein [Prevotellaceae bacterium]|jgi:gliding motility-associated-like protein|nr:gliding motility-associated C-terminal domain-containing protein [Prevotellaceae bacterium]